MLLKRKEIAIILMIFIILNTFVFSIRTEGATKKTENTKSKTSKTSSLKINRLVLIPSRTDLSVGDTTNIILTGVDINEKDVDLTMSKVEYKSTDPSILSVQKGRNMIILKALAPGSAYIIASTITNGKELIASVRINVFKVLNSKTRSTYYTPKRVYAARKNIQRYKWAKDIQDKTVVEANKYLQLGYETLWNLVTPQSIPRSYAVNQTFGCPICGKQIDKFGNYPYITDPIKDPWKIECPICHSKFPTNDFKAYYESGINSEGGFDPKLANKNLLVNTLYPEKGATWGVDDGKGFIDDKGNKFTFIAYYNHWGLWYNGIITKALNSFRDAYIYTGDIRYARAGTILLDRIADVYPAMDISSYKTSDGFFNSDGGTSTGKVVGSIWETEFSKNLLKAYDAFFPAINDPDIINFLKTKAENYHMQNLKKSAVEIRKNIEDNIVRQIYPAVKKAQIRGNTGMHQSTLALAAVVIDTLPETKEWLDFDFQAGTISQTQITGGNILASLINDVDRDGNGNEAAPGYNKMWLSQYIEVANILNGYDLYPDDDLYKNDKFRKMFYAMKDLILSDKHSALIGDSGATGSPINYLNKSELIKAFEQFNDPLLAQLIYFLNGNKTDDIRGDIFSDDPDSDALNIKKIIETNGTLKLNSTNSTGYGFAALRDGKGQIDFQIMDKQSKEPVDKMFNTQRALWLYYGRTQGHGHFDTLNIGLNAFRLDLMPELGYPEYADESPNRVEWIRNTISHNTVVVDKSRQIGQIVSQPKHFDDSEMVKLIDVEAPKVYPQTSVYRRTVAMIKVDDKNSYVVDLFRVKGGSDHYYSFHGAEGAVTTDNLNLASQIDPNNQYIGTYAAPNVNFGIRPVNDSVPGFGYAGSGFQWLSNVQKDANPSDNFSVDWKVKDTWNVYGNGFGADTDIHLRLTMLGNINDVALADGIPPRNVTNNPKSLKYVIAHRQGQNLDSLFTSVIEPYKTERYIATISAVSIKANGLPINDNTARAIKVVLKNGRTDYIVNSIDPNQTYSIDDKFDFKGFFGVYSEKDGKQVYGYLNDGTLLGKSITDSTPKLLGTIVDFTRSLSVKNEVTMTFDSKVTNYTDLIGKYFYAENDGSRNAAFQIKGIKENHDGTVTADIGDTTTIRSFVDDNNYSKGYIYDLFPGANFNIPLVKTWTNTTP